MAGRYTELYALQQNLYANGLPVIVENGRLLKDNKTGGVLAQFKILNISKPIIALKIGIRLRGVSNEDFGEIEYEYLDLKVKRDDTFGTQTPIKLENDKVRAIEPYIKRVVYADNSTVEFDYAEMKPIPEAKGIETVFDREKTALYKKFFCASASVLPCKYEDIWVCACGCVNNADEAKCHSCGFEAAKAFMPIDDLHKELDYSNALELAQKEDKTSLAAAIAIFEKLNGYKDSEELLKQCQERIAKIEEKEEIERKEAERKAEEKRIAEERAAKKSKKIIAIATPIVCACIAFLIILTTVIIPNGKYNDAVALMNEKKYEEAISAFEAMDGYKDSKDQITACQTAIKDIKYNAAVALMNKKKYEEAISAFEAINGYKDSTDKIYKIRIEIIKTAKVGDKVIFGSYEQDNDTNNGKEDIEWLVLAKEDNKILVISKQALDCQQYHTKYEGITWENCLLREWMNGTFLNEAFSKDEQKMIQNTKVSADKNPEYSTNPGNATNDKVFLLSINEAEKYFDSKEARKCAPTAYAKAQGTYTSDKYKTSSGEATCWWWLRSPGDIQKHAAGVLCDGSVYCGGNYVNCGDSCVRPALWINLDS